MKYDEVGECIEQGAHEKASSSSATTPYWVACPTSSVATRGYRSSTGGLPGEKIGTTTFFTGCIRIIEGIPVPGSPSSRSNARSSAPGVLPHGVLAKLQD